MGADDEAMKEDEGISRLPWDVKSPGKLYDRSDQMQLLESGYERCVTQTLLRRREIVVVSGPSGAGKTVLAMRFKETVVEKGGHFVSGKFDQLSAKYYTTSKSYGLPFVTAFTEFCDQVALNEEERAELNNSLRRAMTDVELAILEDFIPALVRILGSSQSTRVVTQRGIDAENNFFHVFCRFVHVISSHAPLVLFLDDIQWADPKSLNLLKGLAVPETDLQGSKLMLLCTFRDDEVLLNDTMPTNIQAMKNEEMMITEIHVGNISASAVNVMVSDLLHASGQDCQSLSDVIFKTTAGNVFFVIQLFSSLLDNELLTSDESGRWHWDARQILETIEAKSVLQLLINKVQQLPQSAIEVLKIASCLGVVFEETTVWCAGTLTKAEVAEALQLAKDKGLVLLDLGTWRFVHDKIQQAVYSLIPTSDQPNYHLNIGRKLSPGLPPELEDDHLLLLVAEQLSRGISFVEEPYEKLEFAQLYLRAGKKAALSSAFSSAATFLEIGISLLSDQRWTENYALTLSLYNTTAEIEYYNGNLDRVDVLVAEVLRRARRLEDALRAHFTRIYSLGTRGDMESACNEGLALLRKLGEPFPRKPTIFNLIGSILSFKRAVRGKQDLDILNLPELEDTTALTALRLMLVISSFAFYVRKEAVVLFPLRIVKKTLQSGLNDMSSAGFGALSLAFAMKGDVDSASRYGKLALQLFDKYDSKEWQARVFTFVYAGIYQLEHHYCDSLHPLLAGHRSGLVLGDMQFSMICAVMYSGTSLECGVNLQQLAKEISSFRCLAMRYRVYIVLGLGVCLQVVLNFMGKSVDPLVLSGDVLNEEEALKEAKSKNQVAHLLILLNKQSLAIYMGDMSAAQTMSSRMKRFKKEDMFPFLRTKLAFQDAFVAARLAQTSKYRRKQAIAKLSSLQAFAARCPQNYQNKVYLVEAELAASGGNADEALVKYQQSIEWATNHNFIHEQGLACERLGCLLKDLGKPDEARDYFRRASNCYASWGAQLKVDQLSKEQ